jgi:hypothetical protein
MKSFYGHCFGRLSNNPHTFHSSPYPKELTNPPTFPPTFQNPRAASRRGSRQGLRIKLLQILHKKKAQPGILLWSRRLPTILSQKLRQASVVEVILACSLRMSAARSVVRSLK